MMDKSLFIFILIGLGALYLVTNFVGDIQEEEDKYHNNKGYNTVEPKYEQYQSVDSIGQPILVVRDVDAKTQVAAWHASMVKEEFLELFPDYTEMQKFVKDRVKGDTLQKKLLKTIHDVEGKFFSGAVNAEQAKQMLGSSK